MGIRENRIINSFRIILGLLSLQILVQCSPDPQTTEVLEVQVAPEEVKTGYIAELKCLVSDDNPENFEYHWKIQSDGGVVIDTVTHTNLFYYKAPEVEGEYSHSVRVLSDRGDGAAPEYYFKTTVFKNIWEPIDPFYEEVDLLIQKRSFGELGKIYLINTNSGEFRLLRDGNNGKWSPEGYRIGYSKNNSIEKSQVHVANVDGSSDEIVTLRISNGAYIEDPKGTGLTDWSLNGERIYIGRMDIPGLFEISTDLSSGLNSNQIIFGYSHLPIQDVSPEGKFLLAYHSSNTAGKSEGIYELSLNGKDLKLVAKPDRSVGYSYRINSARYSKNGNSIAYVVTNSLEIRIYVYDRKTKESKVIYTLNEIKNSENIVKTLDWKNDDEIVFLRGRNLISIKKDGADQKLVQRISSEIGNASDLTIEWRPGKN